MITLVSILGNSQAYGTTYARLEALTQVDNRFKDSAVSVKHLGNITYRNADQSQAIFFDYQLSQLPNIHDGDSNNHHKNDRQGSAYKIRQLVTQLKLRNSVIHQTTIKNAQIDLGRFYRFDDLGYYTLDGGSYRAQINGLQVNVYGGKPLLAEFSVQDMRNTDYLYGIDINQQIHLSSRGPEAHHYHPYQLRYPPQLNYRLGYQAYRNQKKSEFLKAGFNYKGRLDTRFFSHTQLDFASRYELASETRQDLSASARLFIRDSSRVTRKSEKDQSDYFSASYQDYRPVLANPAFRDIFYAKYSLGKQTISEFSYSASVSHNSKAFIALSRSEKRLHGRTLEGYGKRIRFNKHLHSRVLLTTEFDSLAIADDKIESLWLSARFSSSYRLKTFLSVALQSEKKSLYKFNRRTGMRANIHYLIQSRLTLQASAEYLHNSSKDNDYLASAGIRYEFSGW